MPSAASAPEPEAPPQDAPAPSWVFAEQIGLYVVAPAADALRFMVRRDVDHVPDELSGVAATRYWVTRDAYPDAEVACKLLAGSLRYVVSFPLEMDPAEIRIPSAEAPDFVLEPAERPLDQAEQLCLISGEVAGTATGLHPLELSYAKMPGHNAVERVLEKAVATAIHDMVAGPIPGADVLGLFRDEG